MWLIIGLGNPGQQYFFSRHNIGFMVIDLFLKKANFTTNKGKNYSIIYKTQLNNNKIILAKPQTFMNNSGLAVKYLLDYYQIALDKVLVIHDDLDQDFGYLKIQKNRGAGGHNGVTSINQQLATQNYCRLKLGIGRPTNNYLPIADYVLQNFSKEQLAFLADYLNQAVEIIESFICQGLLTTANIYNKKIK